MCNLAIYPHCCAATIIENLSGAHGRHAEEPDETVMLDRAIEQGRGFAVMFATLNVDQHNIEWLRRLLWSRGFRRVRTAPKPRPKLQPDGNHEMEVHPVHGRRYVFEANPDRAIYCYIRVNYPIEAEPKQ